MFIGRDTERLALPPVSLIDDDGTQYEAGVWAVYEDLVPAFDENGVVEDYPSAPAIIEGGGRLRALDSEGRELWELPLYQTVPAPYASCSHADWHVYPTRMGFERSHLFVNDELGRVHLIDLDRREVIHSRQDHPSTLDSTEATIRHLPEAQRSALAAAWWELKRFADRRQLSGFFAHRRVVEGPLEEDLVAFGDEGLSLLKEFLEQLAPTASLHRGLSALLRDGRDLQHSFHLESLQFWVHSGSLYSSGESFVHWAPLFEATLFHQEESSERPGLRDLDGADALLEELPVERPDCFADSVFLHFPVLPHLGCGWRVRRETAHPALEALAENGERYEACVWATYRPATLSGATEPASPELFGAPETKRENFWRDELGTYHLQDDEGPPRRLPEIERCGASLRAFDRQGHIRWELSLYETVEAAHLGCYETAWQVYPVELRLEGSQAWVIDDLGREHEVDLVSRKVVGWKQLRASNRMTSEAVLRHLPEDDRIDLALAWLKLSKVQGVDPTSRSVLERFLKHLRKFAHLHPELAALYAQGKGIHDDPDGRGALSGWVHGELFHDVAYPFQYWSELYD